MCSRTIKILLWPANQAAELVEDKKNRCKFQSKSVPQCISAMVEFNDKKVGRGK